MTVPDESRPPSEVDAERENTSSSDDMMLNGTHDVLASRERHIVIGVVLVLVVSVSMLVTVRSLFECQVLLSLNCFPQFVRNVFVNASGVR